jgi:hypothetical protein
MPSIDRFAGHRAPAHQPGLAGALPGRVVEPGLRVVMVNAKRLELAFPERTVIAFVVPHVIGNLGRLDPALRQAQPA